MALPLPKRPCPYQSDPAPTVMWSEARTPRLFHVQVEQFAKAVMCITHGALEVQMTTDEALSSLSHPPGVEDGVLLWGCR